SFFFFIIRRPPISTLFPSRRSSDLRCEKVKENIRLTRCRRPSPNSLPEGDGFSCLMRQVCHSSPKGRGSSSGCPRDVVEFLPNHPQALNNIRFGNRIHMAGAIDFFTRDHCVNYVSS